VPFALLVIAAPLLPQLVSWCLLRFSGFRPAVCSAFDQQHELGRPSLVGGLRWLAPSVWLVPGAPGAGLGCSAGGRCCCALVWRSLRPTAGG